MVSLDYIFERFAEMPQECETVVLEGMHNRQFLIGIYSSSIEIVIQCTMIPKQCLSVFAVGHR
jgi:hypothetical protein